MNEERNLHGISTSRIIKGKLGRDQCTKGSKAGSVLRRVFKGGSSKSNQAAAGDEHMVVRGTKEGKNIVRTLATRPPNNSIIINPLFNNRIGVTEHRKDPSPIIQVNVQEDNANNEKGVEDGFRLEHVGEIAGDEHMVVEVPVEKGNVEVLV